jgi:hypothetical protein
MHVVLSTHHAHGVCLIECGTSRANRSTTRTTSLVGPKSLYPAHQFGFAVPEVSAEESELLLQPAELVLACALVCFVCVAQSIDTVCGEGRFKDRKTT